MKGVLPVDAPDVLDQVMDHLQKQCDFDKNKSTKINQHICKRHKGLVTQFDLAYIRGAEPI